MTPDRHPFSHVQDFTASLVGARIFSKIDLVRGYHQIPVHTDDIPKTAVITPFSLWELLCMPFGLKNVAQAFQKFLDTVLRGLDFTFGSWARTCKLCREAKIQRHIRAPLQTFEVPHRRFDHINVDVVGPLPPAQGYTHLLTMVDRFTRWPEAFPLKGTDTETCVRVLVFHWVARFGMPLDMTLDRGS